MSMTLVSNDKDLAIDLIETKLREVKSQIAEILKKWDQDSVTTMIQLSREGKLPESEMDAPYFLLFSGYALTNRYICLFGII